MTNDEVVEVKDAPTHTHTHTQTRLRPAPHGEENVPTRFLYITGVGEAVKTDEQELRSLLSSFGQLEDTPLGLEMPQGKGYVYVRYTHTHAATQAKEALPGIYLGGKKIKYVNFSTLWSEEEERNKEPHPEPLDPFEPKSLQIEISGVRLVENFITEEEEAALLAFCEEEGGTKWIEGKEGMTRRVQHYGYGFNYDSRQVTFDPLPPPVPFPTSHTFTHILTRLLAEGFFLMPPDQLTINEYMPGQGINGHVESHTAFRDGVVSLSLGAPIVLELRHPCTHIKKSLFLPPRTALLLEGEARYCWAHGIQDRRWDKVNNTRLPREHRRISFTMRRVLPPLPLPTHTHIHTHTHDLNAQERRSPCLCPFPRSCPSSLEERRIYLQKLRGGGEENTHTERERNEGGREGREEGEIGGDTDTHTSTHTQEGGREELRPTEVEKEHVHAVYETIAEHWNHTRAIRRVHWPRVVHFLQSLPPHSLIADIGCGDGKYMDLKKYNFHSTAFSLGCDRSVRLLQCVKEGEEEEGKEVFTCDILKVPFRDNAFDAALCIAVLHHLSTEAHRIQALRELLRVVRVGGLIDVHVWAMEQEDGSRRKFESQDELVPWHMQAKYASPSLLEAKGEEKEGARADTHTHTHSQVEAAEGRGEAEKEKRPSPATTNTHIHTLPPTIPTATPSHINTQTKLVTYTRYCHLYTEWELERLLLQVGHAYEFQIIDRGYDKGNWFVTLKKLRDVFQEEGL